MTQLPNKIEICPIEEAVFEIRYSSKYPIDAIFGMLYADIGKIFSENSSLPILQLPETVRCQDPNLKYQPYHRLVKDNFILNIGPKVLTFVNSKPYMGWEKWSDFFYGVLDNIIKTEVLDRVERIGLRYINVFDANIFDKVKFEVKLKNKPLKDESTNLRTEILDEGFIKVLQIGNALNIIRNNKNTTGSIVDIDCLYSIHDGLDFFKIYRQIVEKAHNKEKELFFSLLEDSFLKELKPDFGE
jgi:uncharacterized protein (TIGR04255 family)